MRRHGLSGLVLLALAGLTRGDGPTAEEAVARMKLPLGFRVTAVASEPMIRQPLSISFDDRGRMWVLQYLQYPNPAGLKALKQDQYLRTVWDRVPEPPPKGPQGADRITILSEPDAQGVYTKSVDFLNNLNMATGFCLGHGGVYVVQPPYLLFYADKDGDDKPDGDPQVLLTGFGLEDTHALANSLQWGPDGWLYGAQGSTVTARIRNPADPAMPPVEFQQGLWRYHPITRKFELFSEGGGNTYGLDFDKHGQAIAGTNHSNKAMLHQFQGAYYIKSFAKHGPLHNPHTYGYFDHVPYTGFKGGHVTCGGIVYQSTEFPREYHDQYIAGNLLANAIYMHRMQRQGASFTAQHGADLLTTDDTFFRPVDLFQGPDGAVYIADWTDRRAAHLDPVDNWDKSNGRIYRVSYEGTPTISAPGLRGKPTAEVCEYLKHPNKWWRNEARLVLAERRDLSVAPRLKKWIAEDQGLLALEALWALHVSGGLSESFARELLSHPFEHVREWAIRLVGDSRSASPKTYEAWESLARREKSLIVLAQLACTAKRLDHQQAMSLAQALVSNPACAGDAHLPLLIWWALEAAITDQADMATLFCQDVTSTNPLYHDLVSKAVRRLLASDIPQGTERASALLKGWSRTNPLPVLRGLAGALAGQRLTEVPAALRQPLEELRASSSPSSAAVTELALELLARMSDPSAVAEYRRRLADASRPAAERLAAGAILANLRDPDTKTLLLQLLATSPTEDFRIGLLNHLTAYDDPRIGETVLQAYPAWPSKAQKQAVTLLTSRPAWALALLRAIDSGQFRKDDLPLELARNLVGLNDAAVTPLVEKHFGKLSPATAGEKLARITWLTREITKGGPGNPAVGKALFTRHCAACHTLFGEGGKVGPDLTTADRKNRGYMLLHIVDPSAYIRPEYVLHTVLTLDGRKLSGIIQPPSDAGSGKMTLVNVIDNKPVTTVISMADVEEMTPSAISLMPENLLDTLSYQEIRDLFAFLASDPPSPPLPGNSPGENPPSPRQPPASRTTPPSSTTNAPQKTLQICLVSGSFEYESDKSLKLLQAYLEKHLPVRCTWASARSESEISGLDHLAQADAAIFFTRRLKIPDAELEKVKAYVASGKPILGIRTASHGFQNWLEMDKLVFGGDYKNHLRKDLKCTIAVTPAGQKHPILQGVGPLKSDGSLYRNPDVAQDVTVLLTGTLGEETYPVAWTRERGGQRIFYTSLGHQVDFQDEHFLRMLANALAWAATISPRQ